TLSSHLGLSLMYSIIKGVTCAALSHSGCRYSLQPEDTCAAYFSAHSKSDLLKITTFSSLASGRFSDSGALNFLGDKQTQSQSPVNGCAPEVSILVCNPAAFNDLVKGSRLCIEGSPPVITTRLAVVFFTSASICSIVMWGWLAASQLSFTSHQTQPTSHPPRRIK